MREWPVMSTHITSPTNPRVKRLVELRKRRTRDAEGVTVVEGHDELAWRWRPASAPRDLLLAPDS